MQLWLPLPGRDRVTLLAESVPLRLKPGVDGKAPFTADGFSLSGTDSAKSVTLSRPGKGSQSCNG